MRTFFAKLRRRLIAVLAVSIALQGVIFVAPTPTLAATENAYRWRNDDGTESTATYAAAQNTPITGLAKNATTRLRMGVDADSVDGAVVKAAATALLPSDVAYTAVVDAANGYAYLGTYNNDGINTSVGRVIKVALGSGAAAPSIVGELTLNAGEIGLFSAAIDTVNGYAYFGTLTSPGRVIKVALGAGAAAPTRVGAVTLDSGENNLYSAVLDVANGYGYFTTLTTPSVVVKVSLGAGVAAPTRTAALTLSTGEAVRTGAVIDAVNGYAYYGTETSPGKIVKVALGAGAAAPTRIGALTLNTGENLARTGVIDTANGVAYFGTYSDDAYIVKVTLGAGVALPTRVSALTFTLASEALFNTSVIDTTNGYAYFGNDKSFAKIIKVRLSDFTRVSTFLQLTNQENNLIGSVIDVANGYAYYIHTSISETPTNFVKVLLGAGDALPTRTTATRLDEGDAYAYVLGMDQPNGYIYFGAGVYSGKIVKVAMGSGGAAPTRIGQLNTASPAIGFRGVVIDSANGYGYFASPSAPASILKVSLGSGASLPTLVSTLTLNAGENTVYSALIDTTNGYAYFTMDLSPSIVVKVDIDPGRTFARIGAVTLSAGENAIRQAAAIDTTNGYAYFGTTTSPGRIVKVALGAGAAAPTRVGAVTLSTGENSLTSIGLDIADGYGYVGTNTFTGRVVKFALGSGGASPTRTGAVTLSTGEDLVGSLLIDSTGTYGYAATSVQPSVIVKILLGAGAAAPTRVSATVLDATDSGMYGGVWDVANGYAYFSNGSGGAGFIYKISIGGPISFRLEYGAKTSTCSAISSWTRVADSPTTEHWAMSASANITDGASTTNAAGLTNGGSSFVAGKILDTSSQTTSIALALPQFTELEYSISATNASTSGGDYCFRLTDAGSATNFTYSQYPEASIVAGGGTTDPTLNNSITSSRLKAGASSIYNFGFTLQNTITGTLTITFPAGFTVTAAATSGACTGGTVGTFGFTSSTLTAVKTGCTAGALTLSGATVTNHATPGAYTISWVNDDPGEGVIYIIDDDQVTVTGNVDPALTFNAGMQDDTTACDGTFSGNGGTLALGVLTTGSVTTSDASGIDHICTRLSTNSSGGASITVKSLNGTDGLKSTSVPTDTIPSSTATLVAGTAGYGLCTGSAGGDSGNDAISGASSPTRSAPFNTTCTNAAHNVGGLTTSAQNLWTLTGPSQNAFVRTYVKAAISGTTAAHADYADTLTFIGTGTF